MNLLLQNLRWQHGNEQLEGDIRISKNLIKETGINITPLKGERILNLKNHFVYPGLINGHDHLEMNLYSKLGTPFYQNYTQWADDIYKPKQSPLLEIEKVDIKDRLLWGGLKNLISGVTTVIHHNPWHRVLGKDTFPVKVLKEMVWAHSLAFGKGVQKSFPKKSSIPFVIHAGEGVDELANNEVSELNKLGLIRSNTVLIHGIALQENDIAQLAQQQSSLIWCPASNLFMFNKTASVENLRGRIKIALGSDSTLTGSPTLLHEMQAAQQTGLATSKEIFDMVTCTPTQIFNLSTATITPLQKADLFITPIKHSDYFTNLMQISLADISLVMNDGEIKLIDETLTPGAKPLKGLVTIQGIKKQIALDVVSLKNRIEKKVGLSILQKNPTWNLIEV